MSRTRPPSLISRVSSSHWSNASKTAKVLTIGVLAALVLYNALFSKPETDILGGKRRTNEAYFLQHFTEHLSWHPIQARDRLGFAEMGLRTKLYARMLQHQNLPSFDSFEQRLWPFVPGLKYSRRAFFSSQGKLVEAKHGSRGIVLSLGSHDFRFGLHFISMVRNEYKSHLPIEVYYHGDADLPSDLRKILETNFNGVRTIDLELLQLLDPATTRLQGQGWALKPFALLATNFTEVILADADVVFLTKPDNMFDVQGYKETGTLFFHDRDHFRSGASVIIHEFLADQLGKRGPSERLRQSSFWKTRGIYEQESGIVVINKGITEVFSALLFAAWQNIGSIREQTTYRVFWGDKETYWLAFELASFPYFFVDAYAGGVTSEMLDNSTLCSDHPLHFVDLPAHLSMGHSSNDKELKRLGRPAWFNGSILHNKHGNQTLFLDAVRWGMLGSWNFESETEKWCLTSNLTGSLESFRLDRTIAKLVTVAQSADRLVT